MKSILTKVILSSLIIGLSGCVVEGPPAVVTGPRVVVVEEVVFHSRPNPYWIGPHHYMYVRPYHNLHSCPRYRNHR